MSKGAMGERVWLNRDAVPVPVYHLRVPNVLSAISAISVLFIVWGVLVFDLWPTLFGTLMAYMSKLWFVDRMVWLWQDMQDTNEEYRKWGDYGKIKKGPEIRLHKSLVDPEPLPVPHQMDIIIQRIPKITGKIGITCCHFHIRMSRDDVLR